ncbi:MAG: hypothetical protein HY735_36290 [Verrucomicrobia bacterium]|nr:hypothetical protein [Verrucomicrobiota bacterium]
MDLEGLLNASLELEKRIATDKLLRQYFSSLWNHNGGKRRPLNGSGNAVRECWNLRRVTLDLPSEMCELLELASEATGKTPAEILEQSFVEYLKDNKPPEGAR